MKPSIQSITSLGDYQRAYNWDVEFTLPEYMRNSGFDVKTFNTRCVTVGFPSVKNAPIDIKVRGVTAKVPGISTYGGTISVDLLETTDAVVQDFIEKLRSGIWSLTSGKQVADDKAKGTLKIRLLKGDHAVDSSSGYVVHGVLFSEAKVVDSLKDAADVVTPSLTFAYDWYEKLNSGVTYDD